MTLEFDPNNPAKQKNRPVWATYLPGRRGPAFKQHSDRGKALNALGYGNGAGILYHWEESTLGWETEPAQWVEVARTDGPKPDVCERCGGSFMVESAYQKSGYEFRKGLWIGKPKLRYVIVCRECEYAILYPLKKEVPFGEADNWYAKYNRSKGPRKVDQREL